MMSNKTAKATTSKATANKNYAASKNYIAYVAYGSNLSVEQMALRCPDATIMITNSSSGFMRILRNRKAHTFQYWCGKSARLMKNGLTSMRAFPAGIIIKKKSKS